MAGERDMRHVRTVPKVTARSCPEAQPEIPHPRTVSPVTDKGAEMITRYMAIEQIRDRVREADAFRVSRTTRTAQLQARRAVARKIHSGLLAALAAPFRH